MKYTDTMNATHTTDCVENIIFKRLLMMPISVGSK